MVPAHSDNCTFPRWLSTWALKTGQDWNSYCVFSPQSSPRLISVPLFLHLQNGLARPTLDPRNTDTLVVSPLLFTPLCRVGLLWLFLQVFFSLREDWPSLVSKPRSILEPRILSRRGSAPPQGLCTYSCLCLGQKHSTRKQRREGGRRGIQGSRTGLVSRVPACRSLGS